MKSLIMLTIAALMTTSISALPSSATKSWKHPVVDDSLRAKVMYLPISDKRLKALPIKDSSEEVVDLLEIDNPRIKPMANFSSKFKNTFIGFSIVRKSVYQHLLAMLDQLPDDIGIAYFEGYRPLNKQKEYFDKKFAEILEIMPDKELAYAETTKHVSPFIDNVPTHTTGAAIDMTLFKVDRSGESLLDMGKFDVIFGPNEQQETFSKNTTDLQRKNRLLLLKAAIKAGFANYGYEWWHYSYGDKMWAFVYQQPAAIYGLLTSEDDPILSITKTAYLSMS